MEKAEGGNARDMRTEARVPSSALAGTLDDAELLMTYAAAAGIEVSDDVRRAVLSARAQATSGYSELVAANLFRAKTILARDLQPVTAATSKVIRVLQYMVVAFVLVIMPTTFFSFVAAALCSQISEAVKAGDVIALKLFSEVSRSTEPEASGFKSDILVQLQSLAMSTRSIDINARRLSWFVPHFVAEPWSINRHNEIVPNPQFDTDLKAIASDAKAQISAFQDIRAYAYNLNQAASLTYGIVLLFLSILYALLGVCASLLRKMSRDIRERGYVRQSGYLVMFAIAGIGGATLSIFYYEFASKDITLPLLAVTFLFGYAVDTFIALLDHLAPIFKLNKADVREDLMGVNGPVERDTIPPSAESRPISNTKLDLVELNTAEREVSIAYGRLNPLTRMKIMLRAFSPYIALMVGFALTNTLDIVRQLSYIGNYVIFINSAYAQSSNNVDFVGYSLLPILSKIVFLIMFVVLFIITIRDESFSKRPRSISKDLNRAFTGFIIGQITKFVGA